MTTPATPIGQARIRIRADFSRFREDVRGEVDEATAKPGTVKVTADTAEAKARMTDLRADLDRLRTQTATARVALDGDKTAQRQIDRIDLSLRRLGLVTARPKVSVEGVERAKIQLDELEARLALVGASNARIGGGGRGGTGGGFLGGLGSHAPSNMALALGLATPLAVPFGAAAVGGAASFLTPSLAGGIGLGAFGIAAKQNISQLAKTQEAYDKLQAKLANTPQTVTTTRTTQAASSAQISAAQRRLDAAQLRLATAEASTRQSPSRVASAQASVTSAQASLAALQGRGGTTSTTKDNAAYQKLLKQEHDLLKGLDPAQRRAIKNVDALQDAWKGYKKQLEPQSFKALADGAQIGTTGLGLLLPVAKAVGDEVDVLERRVEHALTQPFWKDFFHTFLAVEAPRAVDVLGTTIGHAVTGIAHLSEDFAPLGHDLEGIMVRVSARFEHWTEGEGPGKFVAWVEKNGPLVAKTVEGLASGVEGIAKGLSPIASVELKALTPVLNFIGDLGNSHPGVITALGVALLGVGAGLKVIAGVKGVTGVIAELKGLGKGGVGGILGGKGGVLGGALERGGSPANPLYVFVVDQVGGGGLPVPGGKGKGGGKLAPLAGLSIPLTAAYLATQGGDQAPGQSSIYSNLRGGPNSPNTKAAQALYQMLGPKGAAPFINRSGALPELNIADAVSQLHDSGSAGQQAQLTALAQQYPAIAAALKEVNRQEGVLNQYLAVNTGLAAGNARAIDEQNAALRRELSTLGSLPGYLTAAEQAAQSGGFVIGKSLTDGITIGIAQGADKVALESVKVVKGALHASRVTAQLGSPSKITIQYGRWIAEGLAVGFVGYQGTLLKAFDKATLSTLSHLGGQLSKAADQYRTDLAGRASLKASISQGIAGAADIGGITLSNTGGNSVGGFLGGNISIDKRLLADVKQLKARHLDPRLLEQIVNAPGGPQQGLAIAESILHGKQSVSSLNAQERSLASITGQIGGTVANAAFAGPLARDQRAMDRAAAALEKLVGHRLHLDRADMQQLARDIAHEFAKVFPTIDLKALDRALGLRVG